MLKEFGNLLAQRRQRQTLYSSPKYWDEKAAMYADLSVSMWPNNNLNTLYHGETIAVLDEWLDAMPNGGNGARILDIGCGTGRNSRWFASRGLSVLGIDFSARSLDLARRASTANNPQYAEMSMFDISVDMPFDLMFSWASITVACSSQDDVRKLLNRLHRALTPGGSVLLLEPLHTGFLSRVLRMSRKEFTNLMREAGFVIESVKPLYFWPARLALAYVPLPMAVTAPIYHLGHFAMRLPGLRALADYWAIRAHRPA